MRIIYLHQYFVLPSSGSGGTRSYEMARRLVASGHEVTLITSSARLKDPLLLTPGWHTHEVDGIRLEVLHVPYSNAMSFGRRIKAFIQFALGASCHVRKSKTDLVFATSTPLTIIIPALVAKIWHSIPLVFEVRDLWPELPIAVGALRNPILRWGAQLLEWIAYHASQHIIALSPGMADGVMRRGISSARVTVIPNSCDVELFDVSSEKGEWVRQQLDLKPQQPLIVYTGTFGLINGVGYLVEVAAAMKSIDPTIRFLLVGSGAEMDKVTVLAQKMEVLNHNLWIWSPLPKVQMPDLLSAATVATSLFIALKPMWNNSANKFFDALASGTPVAVNYGGWQAELLREYSAGVVLSPDDPHIAAQTLSDFVHDSERLQKASRASSQLAYEVFNRDLLYAKFEGVLQHAVGEQLR